ncbi:thioredoxin family protein [Carboxylicivirga sp. RSCT41]|uniref:thioredoxin family protein n=1 Tax=Carboxylicivirga agarovorans TaxID=3417570 RepID=UPI003D331033
MKSLTTVALCLIAISISAQGIKFTKGEFKETLAKAEEQDKLVFIDFYTQWCGPCKSLSKHVFTQKQVGEFFNRHFVSIKMDAEAEGKELARKNKVNAYPSLLFFNPQGEVLHRVVGAISADELLSEAQYAMDAISDPNSFLELKKNYAAGKSDPEFLKRYIQVQKQQKEAPYDAINDYLKVQKDMKESYFEMMEFLLNNRRFLICGGEAERILDANYDEFFDIATRREEETLKQLKKDMIMRTRQYALANNDSKTYELFMERWNRQNPNSDGLINNDYWTIELLELKGESKALKKQARLYLNELLNTRSVKDIQAKDKAAYDAFCEKNKSQAGSYIIEAQKKRLRYANAEQITSILLKVAKSYLSACRSKKDCKATAPWIDYGKQLMPNDFRLPSFEADVLFVRKHYHEAIALKEAALNMMSSNDRGRKVVKTELEQMRQAL